MRSSATAQSGLRLLFATNHFITTISLIGFCEQCHLSMNSMGYGRHHHKHMETVRRRLKNRHWAYQVLTALDLIGLVDNAAMQNNTLQVKMCQYASAAH
eukprot:8737305-Pyramimonas_sp.AAC.1